jgi:hypothetical protein
MGEGEDVEKRQSEWAVKLERQSGNDEWHVMIVDKCCGESGEEAVRLGGDEGMRWTGAEAVRWGG